MLISLLVLCWLSAFTMVICILGFPFPPVNVQGCWRQRLSLGNWQFSDYFSECFLYTIPSASGGYLDEQNVALALMAFTFSRIKYECGLLHNIHVCAICIKWTKFNPLFSVQGWGNWGPWLLNFHKVTLLVCIKMAAQATLLLLYFIVHKQWHSLVQLSHGWVSGTGRTWSSSEQQLGIQLPGCTES